MQAVSTLYAVTTYNIDLASMANYNMDVIKLYIAIIVKAQHTVDLKETIY